MSDLYVPQRILSNDRNLARTAALTPSSVQSIASARREVKQARVGSAGIEITGDYSGAEEADFEIKIVNNTGTSPLTSKPVFSGEGSGTLVNIVPESGADPQKITVQLVNEGLALLNASLELEGVGIEMRDGGVGGNDFFIDIDPAGLNFAPTSFSLLADLPAGSGGQENPMKGPQFDWAAVTMGADNKVPAAAKRLSFGDDPTVYVQWKKWNGNEYEYFLAPALQRDVRAGEPIYEVTGDRSVVISDGSDTEVFEDIITLYDFLNAVATTSVLARVTGLVVNDRSPTGMATRDLQTRTDARALQTYGEGSEWATGLDDVTVASDAGTELVKITCFAAKGTDYPLAALGSEYWQVEGSLSGKLEAFAVTGEPYAHPDSDWGFTIPVKLPPGFDGEAKGSFTMEEPIAYVPRAEGENEPPVCFSGKLGPNAQDGTVTLEWTKRPSGDCDCSDMPVSPLGGPCLDGDITEGDTPMALTATAKGKLTDLWDWVDTLTTAVSKYVEGKALDSITESEFDGGTPVAGTFSVSRPMGPYITAGDAAGGYTDLKVPIDILPVDTTFADDAPVAIATVAGIYEQALLAIDVVGGGAGADWTAGMAEWSNALDAWIDDLSTGGTPDMDRIATLTVEKYRNLCRKAVAYSGQTALGKSNASADTSGDGCWQDWGDPYYFTVIGDSGSYAPLFVNHPYWACKKREDGLYYSTKEWAAQINVKTECVKDLKEGDRITLRIGAGAYPQTYQPGDVLYLPVVAAAPIPFKGGQDESNTQTWNVYSDVEGPLPNFSYDPDSPAAYDSTVVDFELSLGGIPFKKGDAFEFEIQFAHFQYRKNGGSWSSDISVGTGAISLEDGLSVTFIPGASPSFVVDDVWKFKAMQPYAASNLQTPSSKRWRWDGSSPTMVFDFGSNKTMDCAAIADHNIPAGATITVEGGTSAGVYTWSYSLTRREGAFFKIFSQVETARYVRLSITSADDKSIGYFWIGEALKPTTAANLLQSPAWMVNKGTSAFIRGGKFRGKTINAQMSWDPGTLEEETRDDLMEVFDWVKTHDNEPFILIPQFERPDCIFGSLAEDSVDFKDELEYHPDSTHKQLLSAKFTVQGAWQAA